MNELFTSLDKIRWHLRLEKITSLQRVLRNKLANKDVINYYNLYLNFENMMLDFPLINAFNEPLNEDKKITLNGILTSFQELKQVDSDIIKSTIYLDRHLNIIKCLFLLQNYSKVIDEVVSLKLMSTKQSINNDNFSMYQKSTWNLLADVFLCYAESISQQINSTKDDSSQNNINEIFTSISYSIEIFYNLLKFQEYNISKKVKTNAKIYSKLVALLFLCFNFYVHMCIKYNNLKDKIYHVTNALVAISRTINYSNDTDFAYVRPFYYLWISLDFIHWFTDEGAAIDTNSPTKSVFSCFGFNISDTPNSLYKLVPCLGGASFTQLIDHALGALNYNGPEVEFSRLESATFRRKAYNLHITIMLDIVVMLSAQTNQINIAGAILLKYLSFGFENSYQYLQLAYVLFVGKHYSFAKNICERIMSFDNSNFAALNLLLNILINTFRDHNKAVENIKESLAISPSSQILFHARAVSYLEQSFDTLSAVQARSLLFSAKDDILKAIECDDNDYEAYFHAGLIFGLLDDIENGIVYAVKSVQLSLFDSRPYNLLFSLLVSKHVYNKAIDFMSNALKEFPDDFSLLYSKMLFEHEYYGADVALDTAKCALQLWYTLFNMPKASKKPKINKNLCSIASFKSQQGKRRSRAKSSKSQELLSTFNAPGTTDLLSSIQKRNKLITFTDPTDAENSYFLLLLICIKIGEFSQELGNYEVVGECIEEVISLNFVTPDVLLLQAQHSMAENISEQTLSLFESALYIDPYHIKTLFSLTHYYLYLYEKSVESLNLNKSNPVKVSSQYLTLAEETARKMVKVEPKNYKSWQCLGEVLLTCCNYEESTFCLSSAVELESCYSIIPLKTIYRKFRPSDINI